MTASAAGMSLVTLCDTAGATITPLTKRTTHVTRAYVRVMFLPPVVLSNATCCWPCSRQTNLAALSHMGHFARKARNQRPSGGELYLDQLVAERYGRNCRLPAHHASRRP